MSRRTVREKVVQALYECDFHPDNVEEVIASRGGKLNEEDRSFYLRLAHGIRQHAAGADAIITRFLKKGWSVGRLSSVDRTILRMAVYELLFEDTPKAAVLNEAVELGKAFGGQSREDLSMECSVVSSPIWNKSSKNKSRYKRVDAERGNVPSHIF